MTKGWNALREDLRRVVFRVGVEKVADAIPADRATVYRLVNGQTEYPTHAVRAGIERVVKDQRMKT